MGVDVERSRRSTDGVWCRTGSKRGWREKRGRDKRSRGHGVASEGLDLKGVGR